MPNKSLPPREASGAIKLGLLLVATLFLLCSNADALWGSSVDVAHHYALVARIAEFWQLPPGMDPSLGEMNFYPRTSHILAAILGALFHSPLIGMQLLTLLSVIALWAGVIAILLSLPRTSAWTGAAILAAVLILNRRFLHLEVHGLEVVGNFFFSQLVAQGFLFGALLLALLMERQKLKPILRHAFLIGAVYLLAGMHLLPASQLVCFLAALIGLEFLIHCKHASGGLSGLVSAANLRTATIGAALMLAAALVLYFHPSFSAMKEISKNNGGLSIKHFSTMGAIFIYCLVILATSGLMLLQWIKLDHWAANRKFLALKYLALYGLAAAGLCLTQLLALKMGQGSEYAVKKHMFALNSIFLIQLSLLPLAALHARKVHAPAAGPDGVFHTYLLLPLLTMTAFFCVAPAGKSLDTSDVVTLEHQLTLRRDMLLSQVPGKHVYVLDFPGMPPVISYMMTIGVFKTPRTENGMDVLRGQPLTEPALVGTLLAAPDSHYGKLKECRQPGSNERVAILDGACVTGKMWMGRSFIGLRDVDGPPNCIFDGFSSAESGGRWTDQKQASLKCPIPEIKGKLARTVRLETSAFLHGKVASQRVSVSFNGGPATEYLYDMEHPRSLIELALPATKENRFEMRFSLPDAVSPKQIGLSEDGRRLGISVKSIEFK